MPQDYLPLLMFMAGAALVSWILLRRGLLRGKGKRKFDSRPIDVQERPTTEWSGAYSDGSALIDRQKVELAQLSRDVNGQLDSKILVLRELIQQSERQIREMEELLAQLQQHTQSR